MRNVYRFNLHLFLSVNLVVLASACSHFPDVKSRKMTVHNMRCESQVEPIGIDVPRPRFSWELRSVERGQRQEAYRITVSASPAGDQPVWDSGCVASPDSIQVEYGGAPLKSHTKYYWNVEVEGRNGNRFKSHIATWETGLLSIEDWSGARWIGDGKPVAEHDEDHYREDPAPLFRKEFRVSGGIMKARLYISGLGWYEARLNGGRVGDRLLDPAWTNYDKRVFYSVYDVTDQLRRGDNCLGVALGNGWYNPLPLRMWGRRNIRGALPTGRPRFIAMLYLEHNDGKVERVISSPEWKTAEGPILRNSIYLGELYDARRELDTWDCPGFDDHLWRPASLADSPKGILQSQPLPPIRQTKLIRQPADITEPVPGTLICDMGVNFTGLASFSFKELPRGTVVEMRYGELLREDGSLNPMTSVAGQIKGMRSAEGGEQMPIGGPGAPSVAWQGDTYIAKGGETETYSPTFTFHAFRYVEITGLPSVENLVRVQGHRFQSDLETAGTFASGNPLLGQIDAMCDQTFRSNVMGVQSDCPHRERFGYGGDLVVTADAFLMHYDMANFYAKVARDWADAARPDGMLTDTAPFVGIQYCGVGWAMAHPYLLAQLYRYYGDSKLMEEQYDVASRWLDLVTASTPDHLIPRGLSDHEALETAPAPVMVTPLYYESARILASLAGTLGKIQDAKRYEALAASIRAAYIDKYFDAVTGKVGPGTQASQAFALQLDMLPEDSRERAVDYLINYIKTEHEGRLSTGIFGTNYLLDYLSRSGHADTAYALVNHKEWPGWGFMLANGATTLWEHWKFSDNTYSHNHPMFGSVSQWLYHHVAGIRPAPDAVGFDHAIIAPQPVPGLNHASARYHSVRGEIASSWKQSADLFSLTIEIPVGVHATVILPARKDASITEAGKPLEKAKCLRMKKRDNKTITIEVESGTYNFVVRRKN